MNLFRSAMPGSGWWAAPLLLSVAFSAAQSTDRALVPGAVQPNGTVASQADPPALVESGSSLFRQDCSFCHGRDAGGGESGPDLTRSKLVTEDVNGDKIGAVVRNGRTEKGMPRFELSDRQIASLTSFIHAQQNNMLTKKGGRKGVDVSDLRTGNAEAGKRYFEGAGGCAGCHSASLDLAGIASRYQGLELEQQMLYPKHAKSRVTVTIASGETVTGTLEYLDEFTVGLMDATGWYRSWRTSDVRITVDAPVNAHVDLLSRYTDANIHDLMAYLQTLR
ncbi:MAG: cytochrome c [Terriglobales bacterium]|jgi:cytochrome c oxidase cbb3-type subunit 3